MTCSMTTTKEGIVSFLALNWLEGGDNDEAPGTAFAARVHDVPRADGGIRRGFQFSATCEEPTREELFRLFNDRHDGSGGS